MDIYFNELYGKLGECIEPGKCTNFHLNTENGSISNMFILRKIPWLIEGVQYYDIVTPYGYGGPIITQSKCVSRLVEDYKTTFALYCKDNRIVSEFIRYHPILRNWEQFDSVYDNSFSRHTVGTNLKDFDDPVQSEFSKSARKELRKAEAAGVSCRVIEHPTNLSTFRSLYEATMDRNGADSTYYFPTQYYEMIETKLSPYVMEVQALFGKEIIASEIYFTQGPYMHAHLLGSSETLLDTNGGVMLEATAARWGKLHGFEYIHHGGGRTSSEDDPLYLYKRKFGKHSLFSFYTGRRIWNPVVYETLTKLRLQQGIICDASFFPQYRSV